MSWLYGQTWLWYLLAFVVGVLLARLFLARRARPRSAGTDRPAGAEQARPGVAAAAPATAGGVRRDTTDRADVDEAVTEQIPAANPALSTLDTSRSGPDVGLAAAAGLGAAGVGAVGLATGGDSAAVHTEDETREIPRVPPAGSGSDTAVIPVQPAEGNAEHDPSGAETTAVIPTVPAADPDATTRIDLPADPAATAHARDTRETGVTGGPGAGAAAAATGAALAAGSGSNATTSDETTSDDSTEGGIPADADPAAGDTTPGDAGSAVPADAAPDTTPAEGAADDADAPFGPGSRRAGADGAAPDPGFGIKGNVDTMRFHSSGSPYFERTRAAVWFRTARDAEQAGFVAWNTRGRVPRTPAVPATPQGLPATPAAATQDTGTPGSGPVTAGRFPGSALPLRGGAAPTPEHTIKGNADSMLYHTTESPYYGRTKAEVWFTSTADAEAAGFSNWKRRKA